jgi:uncharacterized protein YhaN
MPFPLAANAREPTFTRRAATVRRPDPMMTIRHAIAFRTLAAALCLLAAACKKSDRAGGASAKPPDTYESLAAEVIALNNAFIEGIAQAKTKEGAATAIAKLDALAAQYEAVAKRMAAMEPPSAEMKQKFAEMIQENEKVIGEKAGEFIQVMLGNKTLGPILQSGMEEFNARVERLKILEEWTGKPGAEPAS